MSTQKTHTEITPQEALRILADAGKPVEGFAFRDETCAQWREVALTGVNITQCNFPFIGAGSGWAHCARVTITSPIAAGHNPLGLTEDQVGVKDGWRLLTEKELWGNRGLKNPGVQLILKADDSDGWIDMRSDDLRADEFTYRTRHPAGYFLPKPKPKTPWTLETVPKCHTLIRQKGLTSFEVVVGYSQGSLSMGTNHVCTWTSLAQSFEHSTDGGATWKPCGTEVQS